MVAEHEELAEKRSPDAADAIDVEIAGNDVAPWWCSCRLVLAIVAFFGFVNLYALRINMSVAIVCMVNHTALHLRREQGINYTVANVTNATYQIQDQSCTRVAASADEKDGEFDWDKEKQGLILGFFFWGYLTSQIMAGWLATRFGGKRIFGASMLVTSLSTLLIPLSARTHYIFLIVLRFVTGLGSGAAFPAMHAIWGKWAPPSERSKLVGFSYAGSQIGNVITLPLAGLLCVYGFDGGWPSIFYACGCLGVIWSIWWMWAVSDSPSKHPRISDRERDYIQNSLKGQVSSEDEKLDIPWFAILKSMPNWAIVVSNICYDWGGYTFVTCIPAYMKEVLKFDISSNGLFSALPFIGLWATINIAAVVSDKLRNGICSMKNTRKIMDCFGKIVPAILLISLGYFDCSQYRAAVAVLTIGVALTGTQFCGFVVNHVDIAPRYAGVLFGISNSIAAMCGFFAPYVVGLITKDQSPEQWRVVFFITAAVYVFGAVFYAIFADGEVQEWAKAKEKSVELLSMKEKMAEGEDEVEEIPKEKAEEGEELLGSDLKV